jgi:hypothetical protein
MHKGRVKEIITNALLARLLLFMDDGFADWILSGCSLTHDNQVDILTPRLVAWANVSLTKTRKDITCGRQFFPVSLCG